MIRGTPLPHTLPPYQYNPIIITEDYSGEICKKLKNSTKKSPKVKK